MQLLDDPIASCKRACRRANTPLPIDFRSNLPRHSDGKPFTANSIRTADDQQR